MTSDHELTNEQLDARVIDAVPLVSRVSAIVRLAGPVRVVESMDRLIAVCRADLRDAGVMPKRWVNRRRTQMEQLQQFRSEVFSGAIPRMSNLPPAAMQRGCRPTNRSVAVAWIPDVPAPEPKRRPR